MKKSVYIPDDLYAKLEEIAEEDGDTVSHVITRALKVFIDFRRKKKEGYKFLAVKIQATDELEKKEEEKKEEDRGDSGGMGEQDFTREQAHQQI